MTILDVRGGEAERTSREMARVPGRGLYLVAFLEDGPVSHPLGAGVESLVVGRGAESHLRIDRPTLSRRHFALHGGGPVSIEDLGSANGTRVNGRALAAHVPTALEADALIEAGGAAFVVRDRRSGARPAADGRAEEVPADLAARGIVVCDPVMASLHRLVRDTAASTLPVLILGETGAGKEILAEAVHARSPRAAMPFQRINCAALPETLLESELFGYEQGAFTGATRAKQGLVEAADGGTFFFDEIGEMPMPTQAKLLRVLESGELLRLGGLRPRPIDVRFVAATHRDLPQRIRQGTFRRDLYYRLNGVTLHVPPLRQRPGETLRLARTFAERASAAMGRAPVSLTEEACAVLARHPWPGNVRELKHVVERAVALCEGDRIDADHVRVDPPASAPTSTPPPAGTREPLTPTSWPAPPETAKMQMPRDGLLRVDADAERTAILDALSRVGGNQKRAAALLGISRRTLLRRLDEHGVSRPRKNKTSESEDEPT